VYTYHLNHLLCQNSLPFEGTCMKHPVPQDTLGIWTTVNPPVAGIAPRSQVVLRLGVHRIRARVRTRLKTGNTHGQGFKRLLTAPVVPFPRRSRSIILSMVSALARSDRISGEKAVVRDCVIKPVGMSIGDGQRGGGSGHSGGSLNGVCPHPRRTSDISEPAKDPDNETGSRWGLLRPVGWGEAVRFMTGVGVRQ